MPNEQAPQSPRPTTTRPVEQITVAVWDLETSNTYGPGPWDLRTSRVACGVVHYAKLFRYTDKRVTMAVLGETVCWSDAELVAALLHAPVDALVAYNGLNFDIPALGWSMAAHGWSEAKVSAFVGRLAAITLDPLSLLGARCGHPYVARLDDWRELVGVRKWGPNDQPLDHKNIPALWQAGKRWEVVTACRDDVMVLERLLHVGVSGPNPVICTNRLNNRRGAVDQWLSPHKNHPERFSIDPDGRGVWKYIVPTGDWWPELRRIKAAVEGEAARARLFSEPTEE